MPLGEQIQHSLLFQGSAVNIALFAFFVAVILTYIAYRITSPPITTVRKYIFISLRLLAFLLILFALMEPLLVKRGIISIKPETAVLLDVSKSVGVSDSALAVDYYFTGRSILSRRFDNRSYFLGDSLRIAGDVSFQDDATAIGDALLSLRAIGSEPDADGIRPNIAAAILISDGQNNLGDDPASVAARMPFPVYTVGVGREEQPKNIAIKRIVANEIGYKDIPTKVLAYIEGWGVDEEVEVMLRKGAQTLQRKTVMPGQRGEQIEVEFELTPDEVGRAYYRVVTPVLPDELIETDNTRSFSINVLPSRKRILLAFTNLSWEYTFIRRALAQNEHYEVTGADFSGKLKGDYIPPANREEFSAFDAIIMLNFRTDRANCNDLAQYINDGGSVLHIFGNRTVLCAQLLEVSPIEQAPQAWTANRFQPVVTIDGASHPILDFTDETGSKIVDDDLWPTRLPPLRGFSMIDRPKRQARLLMEHPTLEGIPVLMIYEAGRSRQVLINGGDFWRWGFSPYGFGGDSRIFNRIIQNSLQWLMAKDEVTPFRLTTDNNVYRSGEPVFFNASLRDDSGNPLEGQSIELTIVRTTEDEIDTIVVFMEETGGGFYSLRMPSMGIGDFTVRGRIVDGLIDEARSTSFRVEDYSVEMADLRINREMLETIANRSGGKFIERDEYADFLENLELNEKTETIRSESAIWQRWFLLIIILLLLATEWFLRKRSNLP